MTFEEYQKQAQETDYENIEALGSIHFMANLLGLVGEAGEVAEKFKKIYRDKDGMISEEDKESIKKELGDILWYITSVGRHIGVSLPDIAQTNLDKLKSRRERNQIHGNGDNR